MTMADTLGETTFTLSATSLPSGSTPVALVTIPSENGCSHILWNTVNVVYDGMRVYLRVIGGDVCVPNPGAVVATPLNLYAPGTYEIVLQECAAELIDVPEIDVDPCFAVQTQLLEITGNASAHAVPGGSAASCVALIAALLVPVIWKKLTG